MKEFNINRRNFIKGTAAASLAFASLGASGLDIVYREKKYKVGLIGAGWYGKSDLFRLIQVAPIDVVAICDVDKNMLNGASDLIKQRLKTKKGPRLYTDYRKMLSENEFDLVLIGSPDHWHALQAIESLKSGAHVYLQKPISVDVIEGEAILAAARKYNRKVQIGTQRRSTPHLLDVQEKVINTGMLGKISHVEMYCYYHMRANGNPPIQQIPDYFDYDMWTGPAPLRPYDGLPHTRWWRTFMEYGNGIVGDMCVHMFDTVRWLLDLGWPEEVASTGGIYVQKEGKSNISDTQSAIFKYKDLNCVWQHRSWGTPPNPEYPWGFSLYGENGTLHGSTMQADFIPMGKGEKLHFDVLYEREKYPEDLTEEKIELNAAPATRLHMLNFLDAIENNKLPNADIEQGHISTASCIIANMSMATGRPLKYDPSKRIIVNDAEATALLQRPYRGDWEHPTPD